MNSFLTLGISDKVNKILKKSGINTPTPIQEKVIPTLLKGKDVIAKAQTGTGKTYAYVLPMLEKAQKNRHHIQGLILTPTRELAIQITNEIKKITKDMKGFEVLSIYGGKSHEDEIVQLQQNASIVVGTPGRLLDHIKRGNLQLSQLTFCVIDEADQMLQIGFLNKVEEIVRETPPQRQTMLFSATIPSEIKKLATKYLNKPEFIEIEGAQVSTLVNQFAIFTVDRAKQDTVIQLIDAFQPEKSVVFCRTKRRVSKLYQVLKSKGYKVDELHGDIPQEKREEVMERFRKGQVPILIATDVASRGLDIEGVTHVFNYDMPENAESYTHRIGRTGRAGAAGVAYTLYSSEERPLLDKIENALNSRIQKQNLGNTIPLKDKASSKRNNKGRTKKNPPNTKIVSKKAVDKNKASTYVKEEKTPSRVTEGIKQNPSSSTKKRDGRGLKSPSDAKGKMNRKKSVRQQQGRKK
ncbi:DEAD/DEAH box helicase [Rossellomorea aquimaris]|uniref:DEAD/DEAH box helicase n=1 Tax=Rossellomorea aquimaris TaxID=189382 RepID=UPI0007D08FDD|nr:DEAD/DEAH box helicase [Rossellomorea aquimaris]